MTTPVRCSRDERDRRTCDDVSVDVRVRPVGDDDVAECVSLDARARLGLADQRGGEAWLVEHQPLATAGRWWDRSFVAEIDGAIVGFLVGRRADDARGGIFVVDRVYVLDEARELGCGDGLLAAAMDRAAHEGCAVLEATALPGDRDTKNLYERAGVTARSITVSRRLSDPSNSGDASR